MIVLICLVLCAVTSMACHSSLLRRQEILIIIIGGSYMHKPEFRPSGLDSCEVAKKTIQAIQSWYFIKQFVSHSAHG